MSRVIEKLPEGLHPAWVVAVPPAAVASVFLAQEEKQLASLLIAALACVLAQVFLPRARFRTWDYFSPVNVALLLLHIKILLVPAILMHFDYGNSIGALVPAQSSVDRAILIDTAAYVAFCLGLQLTSGGRATRGRNSVLAALSGTPGNGFVFAFAGLGLLGLFLTFGSVGRFVAYFSDPAAVVDPQAGASWGEFLGTILRPFLAFSLVTWWARVADRSQGPGNVWRPALVGFLAATGITIANLTYGFNRGAVVFPLLSLIAVYSLRIRRIPPTLTIAGALCCVPLLLAIGSFRSNSQLAQVAPGKSSEVTVSAADLLENIVVYSGGPVLTGVFYESVNWGNEPYCGKTLISSVLSPIPILGKAFREHSGPIVYNEAIYGSTGIDDQIPPFATELFGNFHIAGVIAGFSAFAALLGRLEAWRHAADSTFGTFVLHYIAVWGAMLSTWSLSVYVQILFYFLGPVYLYIAVSRIHAWLKTSQVEQVHFEMGAKVQ